MPQSGDLTPAAVTIFPDVVSVRTRVRWPRGAAPERGILPPPPLWPHGEAESDSMLGAPRLPARPKPV
ncbi:MAG: hypothetical protein JWR86_1428 [Enterovirga sp.]|jgi:hypothetical protein|nr:hypothetical protein [Enterovirga sp.]